MRSCQPAVARVTHSGWPLSSGIQTSHLWEHSEQHINFIKENVLSRNYKGQPLSTFFYLKVPSILLCKEYKESDYLYIKKADSECTLLLKRPGVENKNICTVNDVAC